MVDRIFCLRDTTWINVPDIPCIFSDRSVTTKLSHSTSCVDAHLYPSILVSPGFINSKLTIHVGIKVSGYQIPVPTALNLLDQGEEGISGFGLKK